MTMDDSSDLGIASGSAGETRVLMCVAINRSWGRSTRKLLSCSSRAVAGDLPEGSLRRTTSKIFAFIGTEFFRVMHIRLRRFQAAFAFKSSQIFWFDTRQRCAVFRTRMRCGLTRAPCYNASTCSGVNQEHLRMGSS